MYIPARCVNQKCRLRFQIRDIFGVMSSQGQGTFVGNATTCPRCGSIAELASFSAFMNPNGVREICPADQQSADMLEQLRLIIEKSRSGELDRKSAVAAAAKISPKAAKTTDWAFRMGALTLVLTLLQMMQTQLNQSDDGAQQEKMLLEMRQQTKIQKLLITEMQKQGHTVDQVRQVLTKLIPNQAAKQPSAPVTRTDEPQSSLGVASPNRQERRRIDASRRKALKTNNQK
jgi:hypothetical protein